jgi:two-component sensor histidine kinase
VAAAVVAARLNRGARLLTVRRSVKDWTAGLLGMVRIYQRSGRDGREVADALGGKIRAIKEVHDIISGTGWEPIDLRDLVGAFATLIAPASPDPRITACGPRIRIAPAHASPLAMILQELFTNSRKHGALASPRGAVAIQWRTLSDAAAGPFELCWQESGGAGAQPPQHQGVGLPLIQGFAAADLAGSCKFHFEPAGLRCVLRAFDTAPAAVSPVTEGAPT